MSPRARATNPHSADADGPELVFAIVKPVGTPDETFHEALESGLLSYGYVRRHIKLSEILSDVAEDRQQPIATTPADKRIAALMDLGDDLCRELNEASSVALLGISDIRLNRADAHSGRTDLAEEARQDTPVPRTAWVIDSIKRVAEVKKLRAIYGDRVLFLGLQASETSRLAKLTAAIAPGHAGLQEADVRALAAGLIDRDLTEGDTEYGQNMLRTFPQCDVFIDCEGLVHEQVNKFLDLMFGAPNYHEPTVAEYGMQLAYTASTRSPELGLKVGAAIVASDYSVLALGANKHPTEAGSPAFDSSRMAIEGMLHDTLTRMSSSWLTDDAAAKFRDDPQSVVRGLLASELDDGQLKALIEYQPPIHAEMSALLDALKNRIDVRGARIYVTDYPCHNCAKHLIPLELEVHYLAPYPKSRAEAMYGDAVKDYRPFCGIAPRVYERLFKVAGDRKGPDGVRTAWTAIEKKAIKPLVDPFLTPEGVAERENSAVSLLPDELMNGETVGAAEEGVEHTVDSDTPTEAPAVSGRVAESHNGEPMTHESQGDTA